MQKIFAFGERLDGYAVPVINERAVRAAAGLLFFPAVVSFMHSFLLGNFQHTRLFIIVFLIDMALRQLNPRWAPSMMVGGWIVRHQAPEWVGAPQKRFAWGLGLALGLAMLYLMVFNRYMGPLNMLICGACLLLMFFETAFGICLGCKLYNLFHREQAQLCPGGVCEVPAQRAPGLRPAQWATLTVFVAVTVLAARWVQQTGPMAGFDEMATLEEMGVAPVAGKPAASDADRCKVPEFAKAIGHEDMWKRHNGCL